MSIRRARRRMGMSLKYAAGRLHCDQGGLSRIERGLQKPRPALAKRIARLYSLTLEDVYGGQR